MIDDTSKSLADAVDRAARIGGAARMSFAARSGLAAQIDAASRLQRLTTSPVLEALKRSERVLRPSVGAFDGVNRALARASWLTKTDFTGLSATRIGVGFAVPKSAFSGIDLPKFEVPSFVLPRFDLTGLAGLSLAGRSFAAEALGHMGGLARFQDVVGAALRGWRDLSHFGTSAAREWSRRALRAALRARQAVLAGRWDEVWAFVRDWLDLAHPHTAHVEAAADALLAPDWEPAEDLANEWPFRGQEVIEELRLRTRRGARGHRWLSETQINQQSVALLDQPRRRSTEDGGTLLDLVAAKPTPDTLAYGIENPRLARVVALMTPQEQEVCLHAGGGLSWAEAAVEACLPPEFGETVRRKRTRLVAEVDRREASRRPSSAGGR